MSDGKAEFWLDKWVTNEIGFHQAAVNTFLETYWPRLGVPAGGRVFVPLCGKSKDIVWLHDAGFSLVGVELSDVAAQAFFEENELHPEMDEVAGLKRYSANRFEYWVGDFFALNNNLIEPVDAVFDRASMIALAPGIRPRYVAHMRTLMSARCQILLLTLGYDTNLVSPPPYIVERDEIMECYGGWCDVEHLDTREADIKGTVGEEHAFQITVR